MTYGIVVIRESNMKLQLLELGSIERIVNFHLVISCWLWFEPKFLLVKEKMLDCLNRILKLIVKRNFCHILTFWFFRPDTTIKCVVPFNVLHFEEETLYILSL